MKNKLFLIIVAILIVVIGLVYVSFTDSGSRGDQNNSGNTSGLTNQYKDLVRVSEPANDQIVESPFWVIGEARGGWFFEANFPIYLYDSAGEEIAVAIAQAQASWMTSEYVPFRAQVNFPSQPSGSQGTLVLKKDNPSGLPEHDDSIEIPIKFK